MATYLATNATKRAAVPAQKVPAFDAYGKVRVLYDEFILSADLSANDLISMMKIPKGARVLNVLMETTDLDVTGGTVSVGWLASTDGLEIADDDGFIVAADVTSAGRFQPAAGLPGNFKQFASEVQVQCKIVGDTDVTSGSIKLAIYISVE